MLYSWSNLTTNQNLIKFHSVGYLLLLVKNPRYGAWVWSTQHHYRMYFITESSGRLVLFLVEVIYENWSEPLGHYEAKRASYLAV